MCVRQIITAVGIPVTFDDRHEPAFSGLRKTLGLKIRNEEGQSEQKNPLPPAQAIKTDPRLLVARPTAGFMASGRSYKMGCGIGGRKLIRGY